MPFQFMCPQGHLLEGVESMMGQQSQCPVCGTAFVVPFVNAPPSGPAAYQPGYPPPGGAVYPGAAGYPGAPYGGTAYPGGAYPGAAQPGTAFPSGYPGTDYAAPSSQFPQMTAGPMDNPFVAAAGAIPAIPQIDPVAPAAEASPTAPAAAAPAEAPKAAAEPPPEERVVRILCPNGHELHTPMDMIGQDAMCPECGSQFRLRYEDSLEYAEERRIAKERREEAFNKAALKWSIVAAVVVLLSIVTMVIMSAMK